MNHKKKIYRFLTTVLLVGIIVFPSQILFSRLPQVVGELAFFISISVGFVCGAIIHTVEFSWFSEYRYAAIAYGINILYLYFGVYTSVSSQVLFSGCILVVNGIWIGYTAEHNYQNGNQLFQKYDWFPRNPVRILFVPFYLLTKVWKSIAGKTE